MGVHTFPYLYSICIKCNNARHNYINIFTLLEILAYVNKIWVNYELRELIKSQKQLVN